MAGDLSATVDDFPVEIHAEGSALYVTAPMRRGLHLIGPLLRSTALTRLIPPGIRLYLRFGWLSLPVAGRS